MYILMLCFGLAITQSSATIKIPGFINATLSIIIFAIAGIIDYIVGMVLITGMLIGGYLGAKFAVKKGDMWVRALFAIVVVASAIKLLL